MPSPPLSGNDVSESNEDISSPGLHHTQSYENAISSPHESYLEASPAMNSETAFFQFPESNNDNLAPLEASFSLSKRPPRTFLPQRRSTNHLTLINVKMSELDIPEGEEFQRRYDGYWAYVIAIVLFYAIPTYQLVLTYQKVLYVLDIVNVREVISEEKFQMFELRVT